jgi:tripartite-type tricarboxylate transporter receptor subunit TctC
VQSRAGRTHDHHAPEDSGFTVGRADGVVSAAVPARTLKDLIAMSKQKPVTIGTAGAGSATHLTLARLTAATGANFTHVPYRGGGALVPDMVAGNINGAMTEINTALPHHRGGKVRVIAIASAARSPQVAEVPTVIESGVKDFTAASYVGILAPAGTPAAVVAVLESALVKTVSSKAFQEKSTAVGAEIVPAELQTSKGFGDYIKAEFERSKEAAAIAGLKPQ